MKQSADLKRLLTSIDHKSYPAYKRTCAALMILIRIFYPSTMYRVTRLRPLPVSIQVRHAKAGFPAELFDTPWKTALEDYLLRCFSREIGRLSSRQRFWKKWSDRHQPPRSGGPSRTACEIGRNEITARFEVGSPAFGRTINSGELIRISLIFFQAVSKTSFLPPPEQRRNQKRITLADDQHFIRNELKRLDLVSFVADGSILPRETGVSDRPMKGSVAFHSPDSLRITLNLPGHGPISGMAIHRGITPDRGRRLPRQIHTAKSAGIRRLQPYSGMDVNMSSPMKPQSSCAPRMDAASTTLIFPSLSDLPNKKTPPAFSTADASGSTSRRQP